MVNTKEKNKLLKEMGFKNRRFNLAKEVKEKRSLERVNRQITVLTSMKFKVTNEQEIEKKICKKYWNFKETILWDMWNDVAPLPIILGVISLGLIPLCLLGGGFRKSKLWHCKLEEWQDNLPYGALLALKEAKERGLKHFEIYYPITQASHRLKTDPVIVGYFKEKIATYMIQEKPHSINFIKPMISTGPMIEVFAWDDGKVYE